MLNELIVTCAIYNTSVGKNCPVTKHDFMKTYRGNGGKVSHILDLAVWRWKVSYMRFKVFAAVTFLSKLFWVKAP